VKKGSEEKRRLPTSARLGDPRTATGAAFIPITNDPMGEHSTGFIAVYGCMLQVHVLTSFTLFMFMTIKNCLLY
jgi:hypothetical protein